MISKETITKRFIEYVKMDTQSDPNSNTTPSTEKQWDLANLLFEELKQLELEEVSIDTNGYVMATIPATTHKKIPTIGFIAHYDTSPDYDSTHVKPQIVNNYDGKEVVLNEAKNIVLSPSYFSELKNYKGQTLITTDGTTLLGADDKAGITEIMSAAAYLMKHPEIAHGKIRIGFTPDEEIGRGAHLFDVEKFGAALAYTMDGSQIGELEYENFNAAEAKITVTGKSVHPGYAKNKMINSILIANDFLSALPKDEVPEKTEGEEGFFHLHHFNGSVEQTEMHFIIRDHNKKHFEARKDMLSSIVAAYNEDYNSPIISLEMNDQYYNMKEIIAQHLNIIDIAKLAMEKIGITPIVKPIRGGTDGSQLSFMGLPCPNLFAGGHNFHGPYEYIPVESMQKATELIIQIATCAVDFDFNEK